MDNKKINELQDQLDIAVFEQEEMDVDKVKEILDKMENISPEEERNGFDKENLWKRIEEQSREEFAEEQIIEFDRIKADKPGKKSKSNVGRARRIALTAATIVLAVFVGANIGTYATEKKNVFEYVGDLANGTSFWITGDAQGMDVEEMREIYYSWNDVPDTYKEFLLVPKGLPGDMELYDIEIRIKDTFEWASVRYIDGNAIKDFTIQVMNNSNEELTFANLKYAEEYELLKEDTVDNINVKYYIASKEDVMAMYVYKENIYILTGTLKNEELEVVVEKTLKAVY